MLKLQGIYTVPQWCLCYLANGDWDNMTEEEKKMVDDWYEETFPNGCTFDFGDGVFNQPYFTNCPDFGHCNEQALAERGESIYLLCECQDIAAYVQTDDEKREHVSVVAIEMTHCDGIKVTVQENIPFIDMYEAEMWAEWRYGYAQYELKPAGQFDFIHEKND